MYYRRWGSLVAEGVAECCIAPGQRVADPPAQERGGVAGRPARLASHRKVRVRRRGPPAEVVPRVEGAAEAAATIRHKSTG